MSDSNPNTADFIQQNYTNIEIFYERLIAYANENIFPQAFYKDNESGSRDWNWNNNRSVYESMKKLELNKPLI